MKQDMVSLVDDLRIQTPNSSLKRSTFCESRVQWHCPAEREHLSSASFAVFLSTRPLIKLEQYSAVIVWPFGR